MLPGEEGRPPPTEGSEDDEGEAAEGEVALGCEDEGEGASLSLG